MGDFLEVLIFNWLSLSLTGSSVTSSQLLPFIELRGALVTPLEGRWKCTKLFSIMLIFPKMTAKTLNKLCQVQLE